MKITLTIPDDLNDGYMKQAKGDEVKARFLMVKALSALAGVQPDDRAILLQGDNRRAIEKIFQTTVDSPEDLVKRVSLLSQVKIGVVEYPLSPGQSSMLSEQASFHGQTPEEYIKTSTDRVMEQLLNGIY